MATTVYINQSPLSLHCYLPLPAGRGYHCLHQPVTLVSSSLSASSCWAWLPLFTPTSNPCLFIAICLFLLGMATTVYVNQSPLSLHHYLPLPAGHGYHCLHQPVTLVSSLLSASSCWAWLPLFTSISHPCLFIAICLFLLGMATTVYTNRSPLSLHCYLPLPAGRGYHCLHQPVTLVSSSLSASSCWAWLPLFTPTSNPCLFIAICLFLLGMATTVYVNQSPLSLHHYLPLPAGRGYHCLHQSVTLVSSLLSASSCWAWLPLFTSISHHCLFITICLFLLGMATTVYINQSPLSLHCYLPLPAGHGYHCLHQSVTIVSSSLSASSCWAWLPLFTSISHHCLFITICLFLLGMATIVYISQSPLSLHHYLPLPAGHGYHCLHQSVTIVSSLLSASSCWAWLPLFTSISHHCLFITICLFLLGMATTVYINQSPLSLHHYLPLPAGHGYHCLHQSVTIVSSSLSASSCWAWLPLFTPISHPCLFITICLFLLGMATTVYTKQSPLSLHHYLPLPAGHGYHCLHQTVTIVSSSLSASSCWAWLPLFTPNSHHCLFITICLFLLGMATTVYTKQSPLSLHHYLPLPAGHGYHCLHQTVTIVSSSLSASSCWAWLPLFTSNSHPCLFIAICLFLLGMATTVYTNQSPLSLHHYLPLPAGHGYHCLHQTVTLVSSSLSASSCWAWLPLFTPNSHHCLFITICLFLLGMATTVYTNQSPLSLHRYLSLPAGHGYHCLHQTVTLVSSSLSASSCWAWLPLFTPNSHHCLFITICLFLLGMATTVYTNQSPLSLHRYLSLPAGHGYHCLHQTVTLVSSSLSASSCWAWLPLFTSNSHPCLFITICLFLLGMATTVYTKQSPLSLHHYLPLPAGHGYHCLHQSVTLVSSSLSVSSCWAWLPLFTSNSHPCLFIAICLFLLGMATTVYTKQSPLSLHRYLPLPAGHGYHCLHQSVTLVSSSLSVSSCWAWLPLFTPNSHPCLFIAICLFLLGMATTVYTKQSPLSLHRYLPLPAGHGYHCLHQSVTLVSSSLSVSSCWAWLPLFTPNSHPCLFIAICLFLLGMATTVYTKQSTLSRVV